MPGTNRHRTWSTTYAMRTDARQARSGQNQRLARRQDRGARRRIRSPLRSGVRSAHRTRRPTHRKSIAQRTDFDPPGAIKNQVPLPVPAEPDPVQAPLPATGSTACRAPPTTSRGLAHAGRTTGTACRISCLAVLASGLSWRQARHRSAFGHCRNRQVRVVRSLSESSNISKVRSFLAFFWLTIYRLYDL